MTWWWTQLKSLVRQECTSRDWTSLEAQQLVLCRFMWCRTGNQGSSSVSRAQTAAPQRHPSPDRHSPPTEKSHKLCLPFLSHCVHREQCYHSLGGKGGSPRSLLTHPAWRSWLRHNPVVELHFMVSYMYLRDLCPAIQSSWLKSQQKMFLPVRTGQTPCQPAWEHDPATHGSSLWKISDLIIY